MRGTWQTTGGFDPAPLLVLIGAAVIAGPVAAAVAELVHALLIAAVVLLGLAAAGLVAIVAWRVHRSRAGEAARIARPGPPPWRPVQARSEPQRLRELPLAPPRAVTAPREVHVHHHWHGVSAEEIAAIIHRHGQDR